MSKSKLQFLIGNRLFFILFRNILLLFLLYFFQLLILISSTHQFREYFRIVIINILVNSSLQSLHQLLFNTALNVSSNQRFRFSHTISPLCFLFYWNELLFTLELQLSHLNEHLSELCQSLLAFVNLEGRPIDQILIDLLQRLCVAFVQPYLLPQLTRQMCSLRSFHKQITDPLFLPNRGIL